MASRQAVPSDTFRTEPPSNRRNPSRRRRFVSLAYRRRRQSSHAWARPCLAQRPCLGQRPLSWASEAQAILRQTLHTSAMLVRTSTSVENITNHVSQKGSGYAPCQCSSPGAVNTCTPLMLCRCEGSWPLSTNPSVSHKITNAGRTSCHVTKCSCRLHGANR